MAEPNGGVSGESASILVERLRFSTSFKTNHVFKFERNLVPHGSSLNLNRINESCGWHCSMCAGLGGVGDRILQSPAAGADISRTWPAQTE
jgi:hypothetical protein